MSDFSGKYQYQGREGAFRARFNAQTFTLTPEYGAAMAFDLGDLDAVVAADWEIRLPL